MVKKKSGKKGGKSSGRLSARSDEEKASDPADPLPPGEDDVTLISSTGDKPTSSAKIVKGKKGKKGTKKKGGKKGKMTKEERQMHKLNKLASNYTAEQKRYEVFVDRADRWLQENGARLVAVFTRLDRSKEGRLTYAVLKSGLIDMMAPFSFVELHLLCLILDTDNDGHIEFAELDRGLKDFRKVETVIDEEEEEDELSHIRLIGPRPDEWVRVMFRFVTFETELRHPGHFEVVVPIDTFVKGLVEMVYIETQAPANDLTLFSDNSRSNEARLEEDMTLSDYRFRGGPRHNPPELLLFYDYRATPTDCPLLLCDHYFAKMQL